VVRVDLTIHREPLTDEDVELCFGAMQRGVQEFAKRHISGGFVKNLMLDFNEILRGTNRQTLADGQMVRWVRCGSCQAGEDLAAEF